MQNQPDLFSRRLSAYGAAAAAGLAVSQPASAAIVYTNLGSATHFVGNNDKLDLDLRPGTGITFYNTFSGIGFFSSDKLRVDGRGTNSVVSSSGYARNLNPGFIVGPGASFSNAKLLMASVSSSFSFSSSFSNSNLSFRTNPWADGGILGVKFFFGPDTYYGWVRLTVDNIGLTTPGATLIFSDMAYEACPGVGIEAGAIDGGARCSSGTVPEPSSLGFLALGAAGLAALRRKRPVKTETTEN